MARQRTDEAAFWAHVRRAPDGCWPYQPADPRTGYGRVSVGHRLWQAHRLAWTFSNGPIPKGLFVCHTCDNRPCCNPAHLFLGTATDNNRDAVAKGRAARGERSRSTLTEEEVRAMRAQRTRGDSLRVLARRYGVSNSTVFRITTGQCWAWLPQSNGAFG